MDRCAWSIDELRPSLPTRALFSSSFPSRADIVAKAQYAVDDGPNQSGSCALFRRVVAKELGLRSRACGPRPSPSNQIRDTVINSVWYRVGVVSHSLHGNVAFDPSRPKGMTSFSCKRGREGIPKIAIDL